MNDLQYFDYSVLLFHSIMNFSSRSSNSTNPTDPEDFSYIARLPPDMCMKAIARFPHVLRFVTVQTSEMCMKAVEQNGYALRFVKDQTTEICMKAVEQIGSALQCMNNNKPHQAGADVFFHLSHPS